MVVFLNDFIENKLLKVFCLKGERLYFINLIVLGFILWNWRFIWKLIEIETLVLIVCLGYNSFNGVY